MSEPIERIWRRLLLVIGRGRVKTVTDGGNVQTMQVQLGADEIKDGTPRLAEYGFNSSPPIDSDAIVLFLAGERTNGVVIACGSQRYRMKGLASGEVAINDDKGQSVYLSAAGIRIDGGGLPINVANTSHLTITADALTLNGPTTINGPTIINGETAVNGATTIVGDTSIAGDATITGNTSLIGGMTHAGGAPVFEEPVVAPDFQTPSMSALHHRHGGVRGGGDSSGPAIPLT